jgi:DNA-binding NarL/FixJ family response regulator
MACAKRARGIRNATVYMGRATPIEARVRTGRDRRGSDRVGRPRRAGRLTDEQTPHELQVALVVARGATNKEAAAELFLSPKTVEFHLQHIYSKLDVRSRTELARLLARGDGSEGG